MLWTYGLSWKPLNITLRRVSVMAYELNHNKTVAWNSNDRSRAIFSFSSYHICLPLGCASLRKETHAIEQSHGRIWEPGFLAAVKLMAEAGSAPWWHLCAVSTSIRRCSPRIKHRMFALQIWKHTLKPETRGCWKQANHSLNTGNPFFPKESRAF